MRILYLTELDVEYLETCILNSTPTPSSPVQLRTVDFDVPERLFWYDDDGDNTGYLYTAGKVTYTFRF